ncbi:hypothetical protein SAMN05444166_4286 [Singulisphaera sp. GP187]|uniref:hypothetical protein n=1 Tax=Singulisphaera sp. GP187 TaxID=1882752 RepID=UPI00092CB307|nr:hypothetical protein [Singulisphaera sp. GP187]SIO38673.1 hypothetical protein SAMN05444166_4286 [Singulisphaera sp. GP187]
MSWAEAVEHVQRVAKSPQKGWGGQPMPRTFRLASGKISVEPKRAGGFKGLAEMLREVLHVVKGELSAKAQDAA